MSPDALALAADSFERRAAAGPWSLPRSWAWTSLAELTAPVTKIDPAKRGSAFKYIDLSAIESGAIRNAQLLEAEQSPSRARQLVNSGDTLFSGVRVYLENIALVDADHDGAIASTAFSVLRPRSAIDPRYLVHFVKWRRFISWLLPLQRGHSPPAVLDSDVKAQPIPLPPLPEQRRIVARIDELFAEIAEGEAALERARQGLDTWRRALLKAAVTGELTRDWREANRPAETGADLLARIRAHTGIPSARSRTTRSSTSHASLDANSLSKLPEGWAWAPLGEVIESLRNGTATVPVKRRTEYPILRISAVRPMAVDASDIRYLDENSTRGLGEFQTRAGDLLFTRYNGSRHLVGVCGIYRGGGPVYYPDKIIRVCLVPQLQEISAFFEAAINSGASRKFIDGEIKTTAGQHGISGASLKRVPIPIPPITEAKRISELLQGDLARADDMEAVQVADFKAAAALCQSILKAAFEGRLVAQDPTDEPASTLLARLRCGYAGSAVPRRRARASAPFSHPSLPGLTGQSWTRGSKPAGDD